MKERLFISDRDIERGEMLERELERERDVSVNIFNVFKSYTSSVFYNNSVSECVWIITVYIITT